MSDCGGVAIGGKFCWSCSASSCFVAHSAKPLIWSDSAVLMKDWSMCCGTLASPLYMYSTKALRLSKSTSFMKMTGCLSFKYDARKRVWKRNELKLLNNFRQRHDFKGSNEILNNQNVSVRMSPFPREVFVRLML